MSIRREIRGGRASLTAVVATILSVVATLAVTAQSASAYVPCPRPISAGGILNWNYLWPTAGADAKGVTLCQGFGSVFSKGYLQIVDLSDGAKIRLVSSIEDPPDPFWGDHEYFKKTAADWYSHIRGGWGVSTPSSSRLFSTTNASYFNDATAYSWTTLPFPHRFNGVHETWGTVFYDQWLNSPGPLTCYSDGSGVNARSPEVCAPKRIVQFGDPTTSGAQRVNMYYSSFFRTFDWLGYMDGGQSRSILADGGLAWDATVGFPPTWEVGATGAANRRNYLGIAANRVYIFTSDTDYTAAEANAIMQEIYPGMVVIQLDGGGSAQFHSAYGSMDSSVPSFDRAVPDVLAIYRAP